MKEIKIKPSFTLDHNALEIAKHGRNLLAFSHGADSTALFYLLNIHNIEFDLAMFDYGVREQSKQEVAAAKALADKFKKRLFVQEENIKGNDFENRARKLRYKFFSKICAQHNYTNIITAHQLNDRFEWALMRLARGAGLSEMIGMSEISHFELYNQNSKNTNTIDNNSLLKNNKIMLLRPLLSVTRNEILDFLHSNEIKYFNDASNADFKFERNRIRHNFASKFISEFGAGVARSFELLQKDNEILKPKIIQISNKIIAVKVDINVIRGISMALKRFDVVISAKQRDEIYKNKQLKSGVISGKIAVGVGERELDSWVIITPYLNLNTQKINLTSNKMSKEFKEKCRLLGVSKLNRAFLHKAKIDPQIISNKLKQNI